MPCKLLLLPQVADSAMPEIAPDSFQGIDAYAARSAQLGPDSKNGVAAEVEVSICAHYNKY